MASLAPPKKTDPLVLQPLPLPQSINLQKTIIKPEPEIATVTASMVHTTGPSRSGTASVVPTRKVAAATVAIPAPIVSAAPAMPPVKYLRPYDTSVAMKVKVTVAGEPAPIVGHKAVKQPTPSANKHVTDHTAPTLTPPVKDPESVRSKNMRVAHDSIPPKYDSTARLTSTVLKPMSEMTQLEALNMPYDGEGYFGHNPERVEGLRETASFMNARWGGNKYSQILDPTPRVRRIGPQPYGICKDNRMDASGIDHNNGKLEHCSQHVFGSTMEYSFPPLDDVDRLHLSVSQRGLRRFQNQSTIL